MVIKTTLLLFVTALVLPPLARAQTPELSDPKDKLSYSLGLKAGAGLKQQSVDPDLPALKAGIADGLSGRTPRLDEAEMKTLMRTAKNELTAKRAAERKAQGEKNALEGPKFLAENKNKEGVKTTASGLQYKVLTEGTGPVPKDSDRAVVNFTGSTIDGKEFENSAKSGHAETLQIDRMIKGWREGVQLMKSGAKYRFFVPADLAFGKNGAGAIAPNAALIFDLELVGIVPETPPSSPAPSKAPGAAPTPR